jgi:hypothetical protein
MQQLWTERGIKGAKYLTAGAFFVLGQDPALALAQGNYLAMAGVHFLFGVVGPILAVAGLYLIGTRNKQAKK